jgi:hypothetical protein
MAINKIGNVLGFIITGIFGMLAMYLAILWNVAKNDFLKFRLIEILTIFVMLFIGRSVAYWVALSSNSIQKKKELGLQLITEAIKLSRDQKELTVSFTRENRQENGKLVLSGFRKLNNKLDAINKICNAIDDNLSAQKIITAFYRLKEQFGDNYLGGFTDEETSLLAKDFDLFEKDFDDLRIDILLKN